MKTPAVDMLAAAKTVLPNAYAPYSHFSVAAVVRAENGALFSGCNVENAAYPLALCAEAGAMAAMYTQGQKKVTEVLVLVPGHKICPLCGACRQRLLECAAPETIIHLCTLHGHYEQYTLAQLIPHAFNSKNLEERK